ncbi:MAG: class I SAM-dependent methyltransferase [Verrucomicrobiota bacterium]
MHLNQQIHVALQGVCVNLCKKASSKCAQDTKLLDVGCWNGRTTLQYGEALNSSSQQLYGLEYFDPQIAEARAKGIIVQKADLEKDEFPFQNEMFDIVACNQVLEHLKQIFHPMDEIWRVLKPDGYLILSVPNLASFHNRIMMLLGMQPTSIRIFGPHVRGFTYRAFVTFATQHQNFRLIQSIGVGFYPFPPKFLGNWIGNIWKSACHTPVLLLQKPNMHSFVPWSHGTQEFQSQTIL